MRSHLTSEEEQILISIQSAELSFEVSDLFKAVPDDEATHNHPSLLLPLSEDEGLLYPSSESEDNSLHHSPSQVEGSSVPLPLSLLTAPTSSQPNHPQTLPIPIFPTTMATIIPLPSHNERKAPKWDSLYEEQLPTFLEEFETVATDAAINTNDGKMKKEVLRYVDAKTMHFWHSLDTFDDIQKTWDEFKTEVLSNYPGTEQVPETMTDTLKKVVTKFAKSGVSNSQELAEYHREFATIAKSLSKHGILSGVQLAGMYVQVFPNSVHAQLNMRLQFQYPNKKKGEAYSLSELKGAVDFLLSDASTSVIIGNFNLGDQTVVPVSSATTSIAPKTEPEDPIVTAITKLTQMVSKMVDGGQQGKTAKSSTSNSTSTTHSSSDRTCYWDGCNSKRFSDCPDLAEWVAKGRIERSSEGYIVLKGGGKLSDEDKYKSGLIKARFERYFEDNPSVKSWILKTPSLSIGTLPELAGVAISTHSKYSLNGYQGPGMLEKVVSYMANDSTAAEPEEEVLLRQLIFKMETRRAARERTSTDNTGKSASPVNTPDSNTPVNDEPEPSKVIPPGPMGPMKPPKPIIGKLSQNYVPPAECSLGAPPKDDGRNYHFRAPIETEAAVEWAIQAGLTSMVSIRQDDLLAIAPDYRKKIKDSVMGRRVGFNGKLLEEVNAMYLVEPAFPFASEADIPAPPNLKQYFECPLRVLEDTDDPVSIFFQDFAGSEEGDGFYVAKDSLSIRGINATVGERSVHCITDSGCSIVAMSDNACNALGIAFDPS